VIGINISGLKANMIERLMPVMSEANHVRQFGANALEMCYLARGFLDAYIDFRAKIRPTDIAGAYLIASEAGGMLYSDDGSQLDSDLGVKSRLSYVAASNNKIFRRIAAHLFDGQLT
jgi:myo-inositol-1(or 4)-monophosphatase